MITVEHLLAHGFEKDRQSEEWHKPVPVCSLSSSVRSLFQGTDVNDEDMAVVWVVFPDEVGISVWDCNAHKGVFDFSDATGVAILRDAGIESPVTT
ncbi:hypothetical protein PQR75_40815 [Paraburkholderia fungorum]|uniref:hypothetical protein n=1 Tax=Paraburkholderia fungorum TaxID=134537 RepID=UPI0038B6D986